MFSFIKETLTQGYEKIKEKLGFNLKDINTNEIEKLLIENNFGIDITKKLIARLKSEIKENNEKNESWINIIRKELINISNSVNLKENIEESFAFMLVGINGSGKTTTTIKLARKFKNLNNKVLVIAADTFRVAAQNQISILCKENNIDVFDEEIKDPSAIVFKGCNLALEKNYEKIIIDTAGRMHSKDSLIKELKKIQKTTLTKINEKKLITLLVLDSLQGKALLEQASIFNSEIKVDGIILTKLDAGTKPGIIYQIIENFKLPILFITEGQQNTEILKFDPEKFTNKVLGI
jgi:fused signal recognition particle receptor